MSAVTRFMFYEEQNRGGQEETGKRRFIKEFRKEMIACMVAGDQFKIYFGNIYIGICICMCKIIYFAKHILQNFPILVRESKEKEMSGLISGILA